jgi:aldose sugar dehydrogenase
MCVMGKVCGSKAGRGRLAAATIAAMCGAAGSAMAQPASKLWDQNCASCHGENGEGGGAGTKTLLNDTYRDNSVDRRFFDAIKNGVQDEDGNKAAMEAFGTSLKDEQVWALVVHIRELQARAHRKKVGSRNKTGQVYESKHHSYKIEPVVTDDLDTPWAVDFLPPYPDSLNPTMLITEREGRLRVLERRKLSGPVSGIPKVYANGQGGLMDVLVHPDYEKNGWIYLSLSDPGEKRNGMTRIVRGKLSKQGNEWQWTSQENIWQAKPEHYLGGGLHFGCKIVITEPIADGADKGKRYLYFGIGERGRGEHAQEFARPNGKIHRIFDDGTIPGDNPFVTNSVSQNDAQPDGKTEVENIGINAGFQAYPSMWSFGHRNPQGLAMDLDGNIWDTEHGPRGGDEFNIIKKSGNYGWPLVSYGINYTDQPLKTPWSEITENGTVTMPVFNWTPSIGACGLTVLRDGKLGIAFPKWKGDFFAGGLSGANVDRLRVLKDSKSPQGFVLEEREEIVHGMGRVRDVRSGPDGTVYIVLNGPDKVMKLVPPNAR